MKQKKAEKGLYVSRSKFAKFIAVIIIVIVALIIGNIVQLRKNIELKALSERMTKQSSSVQEDKNELEKTLKEKEAEIEELNNSLSIEEELKTNVNLVKNLRANNEKLQKRVEELEASSGTSSGTSSDQGTKATTETVTVATTETVTVATTETATSTTNTTATTNVATEAASTENTATLVADKMTKYFHKADCQYVAIINADDKVTGTKEQFEADGYKACTYCNP